MPVAGWMTGNLGKSWQVIPIGVAFLLLFSSCSGGSSSVAEDRFYFRDVAAASGLSFTHLNGAEGRLYLPEIMGAGGALFDYDLDGDLDVYLCQGGPLEPSLRPPGSPQGGQLFQNQLVQTGQLRFVNVTQTAGIQSNAYGMGAAVGDVDNDGYPDLYLTNFGPNQLWRNLGDGTFEEITAASGTGDDRWSVSATFVDVDRDGWQDLFVVNYVDFTLKTHKDCFHGQRDYCHPDSYAPEPDLLLRNRGDGTFENLTGSSRVATAFGNGLGVVAGDFDQNGWLDIFVANDANANQIWMNQGSFSFTESALLAGAALNHAGHAESGMGVVAADLNGDLNEDLFLTHLTGQTNTLYLNDGQGNFEDRTIRSGLASPSTPFTGFGAGAIDVDNDGWLDLVVVNGTVTAVPGLQKDPFPYHQTDQFFRNLGEGRFVDESTAAGFHRSEVGRGTLFGDIDNDGDVDFVINNNNGPARLMLNQIGQDSTWIGLSLDPGNGSFSALGAWVLVETSAGRKIGRRVSAGSSYASSNDPRVIVGLGAMDTGSCKVTVAWVDGTLSHWENLSVREWHNLRRGEGAP